MFGGWKNNLENPKKKNRNLWFNRQK